METQALEKTFATHDEFNRKPIAENIIRLLTSPIDLSPMVIDGGWGMGKTEFCQKLIRLMQQQHPDYQPVYIDAFRSDHSGEPLLALLAEIIKACTPEDTGDQPSEQRKNITRKVAKAAGFVMKTVAKAAVGHVLKQNTDDLAEEFQQIMNDGQLVADKPIILFIDELDRCRPDYAVDMLEVIKHVFDVENVKVVLVTNTKQLRAAINHRYGAEVDAQKYLDKFLKYSFALPEKVVARFEEERALVAIEYFKQLIRNSSMAGELRGLIGQGAILNLISDMVERNNLSLRETERLVRFLEIYHSLNHGFSAEWAMAYRLLSVVGVFVFCFYPNLMDNINKNRTDAREFAQLFNLQSWPNMRKPYTEYKYADVIAVMLILHSKIEDSRFTLLEPHDNNYWKKEINKWFFENRSFGHYCEIDEVLSVLKNTFQVLSFEQEPQ